MTFSSLQPRYSFLGPLLFSAVVSLVSVGTTSCSVEEFPYHDNSSKEEFPSLINLKFNLQLPLLSNVDFSRSLSNITRHQIWAFPQFRNGKYDYSNAFAHYTFFDYNPYASNQSYTISLPKGVYQLVTFTDFVDSNDQTDLFYDTSALNNISLSKDLCGNSDYRDCFSACQEITINGSGEHDIILSRPLAKYEVIATDVQEFYSRILQMMAEREEQNHTSTSDPASMPINLNDYSVRLTYPFYLPTEYNIFTDSPVDASLGVAFEGRMSQLSPTEILLAFDYVFVNHADTSIDIIIQIIENSTQEIVSTSSSITVPLSRSHLTIVKGNFLTAGSAPGMSILPDFNGNYNVEIR